MISRHRWMPTTVPLYELEIKLVAFIYLFYVNFFLGGDEENLWKQQTECHIIALHIQAVA